jgi:hypothetical protein
LAGDFFIGRPLKTQFKFTRPAAAIDEMGMAIHKAGGGPSTISVINFGGSGFQIGGQVVSFPYPGNPPLAEGQHAVFYHAVGTGLGHCGQVEIDPEGVDFIRKLIFGWTQFMSASFTRWLMQAE